MREEELLLVIEVVRNVVHHRRLTGAGCAIDQCDARLAEQQLERIFLDLVVDATRRLVEPALDGLGVASNPGRRELLKLLDDGDGVVLVATDEDVSLVKHEPSPGVLEVERAVISGDQLADVSKRLQVAHRGIEDPVTLHVVRHTSGE